MFGFGGLTFGYGGAGDPFYSLEQEQANNARIDRSNFAETSQVADQRLLLAQNIVNTFNWALSDTLLIEPSVHLVDTNYRKFQNFVKSKQLFVARVKATDEQRKNIVPAMSRRTAYFVAVSRAQANAKNAALNEAARHNYPAQFVHNMAPQQLANLAAIPAGFRAGYGGMMMQPPPIVSSKKKGAAAVNAMQFNMPINQQQLMRGQFAPMLSGKAAKASKKVVEKVPRAPSPFILFCGAKRAQIKAQHPNATFSDIGKMLGQLWTNADEAERAPFVVETEARRAAILANKPPKVEKLKHPPTPFILFCVDKRPEVKRAHPTATFSDLGKYLGTMWASMSEEQKAPYRQQSDARRAEYERLKAEGLMPLA